MSCSEDECGQWQLANLTQLTELTLRGGEGFRAMRELLASPAPLALPASLHVLRLETADTLCLSAEGLWIESPASSAIPVLELSAEVLSFDFVSTDPADGPLISAALQVADLPAGFSALWLRTGRIVLGCEGYDGGDDDPAAGPNIAEEMCRFCSLAPTSYREFRLFHSDGTSDLTVEAEWLLKLPGARMQCSEVSFGSLDAMAAAMHLFDAEHGLTVSVSDDQTHLHAARFQ